jgi:hypothetical protein
MQIHYCARQVRTSALNQLPRLSDPAIFLNALLERIENVRLIFQVFGFDLCYLQVARYAEFHELAGNLRADSSDDCQIIRGRRRGIAGLSV